MDFIKGTYSCSIYRNEENGYTVGLLKVKEVSTDDLKDYVKHTISIVGTFHEIKNKSEYVMHGELTTHPKYGSQFKVSSYEFVVPSKKEDLITFLSSELFPIGVTTATKIFNLFGEDAIKKILDDYTILLEIPRISEEKALKIHDALKNYEFSNTIILKLTSFGFTLKQALSLYSKLKVDTLNTIETDLYSILDIIDINFKDIDTIAINNGVSLDDEGRIKALIIYLINEYTFNLGDTYILFSELFGLVSKFVSNINEEILEYMLIKLNQGGKIIIEGDKYYLANMYRDEKYIASRLSFLNDLEYRHKLPIDKFIDSLEQNNNISYDKKQKEAISKALTNNLLIITGGPGTGKTTIIKAIVMGILDVLKGREIDIALLAPTGRAAKRMSESVLLPAMTIHRYLKWDKDSGKFGVDEYNPNCEKYIIIDEVSMIDNTLMAALLKGLKRDIKLILVGDYHQLPSVAQGQILKDLIDSEMFDVIHLDYLYRQSDESYIPILAKEIKDKDLSDNFLVKKDDYNFISCLSKDVRAVLDKIIDKALEKGMDEHNIQILAPMYKGENGVDNLNVLLESKFNKEKTKELLVGDVRYKVGDKILQLVNDPENNVFNGDIGYIIDIKYKEHSASKKNEILIDFDGNIVSYNYDHFHEFRHGYAISVHKAQGNEFDMVIIPIVSSFKRMLYNRLIYTAITRAKKTLILIGERESFVYSVNNDYIENRRTTLKDFIKLKYNIK